MTYNELEKEVIRINNILRSDMVGKFKLTNKERNYLIHKSHDLKSEMNRCWESGEMKTRIVK